MPDEKTAEVDFGHSYTWTVSCLDWARYIGAFGSRDDRWQDTMRKDTQMSPTEDRTQLSFRLANPLPGPQSEYGPLAFESD